MLLLAPSTAISCVLVQCVHMLSGVVCVRPAGQLPPTWGLVSSTGGPSDYYLSNNNLTSPIPASWAGLLGQAALVQLDGNQLYGAFSSSWFPDLSASAPVQAPASLLGLSLGWVAAGWKGANRRGRGGQHKQGLPG
jgi:hypothetical protein